MKQGHSEFSDDEIVGAGENEGHWRRGDSPRLSRDFEGWLEDAGATASPTDRRLCVVR